MTALLLLAGLVMLIAGAEALVRGASRLATLIGMPPLVIGLTVVAFGTSAPELAVSVKAVLAGQGGIALGNVVGSNIFNVLFILGASALVSPLVVAQQLVRLEVPLMIGLSLAVLLLALDGAIGRTDGLLLVAGLCAYTAFVVHQGRAETAAVRAEYEAAFGSPPRSAPHGWARGVVQVAGGLGLLVIGSGWLVDAAVAMARALGVSELVVGLTIVAAGTSLPEVVTSLVATARGERDIAVGNVVGSNLFNLMGVLGVAAVVAPRGIAVSPGVLRFDLPVMGIVALACLPIFFTGARIARWEGALLLGYWAAYTTYLVLAATHHDALPAYGTALVWFALPLTGVTLAVISAREIRARRRTRPGRGGER